MRKHLGIRVAGVVAMLLLGVSIARAHEVTYLGTVVAVEAARVQAKTTDPDTKKEVTAWFVVNTDTRVKRGDAVVSYADANIMKSERIAIVVDHDAKTKMLAVEIRLAEMDAMAVVRGAQPGTTPPTPAAPTMPAGHQMPGGQQMPGMSMGAPASGWQFMQDGVVYGLFNHQGGPRGGNEFVVPNWWMGMWTRESGSQQFGLNAMFSLDPATVGKSGYREIFQVGEALDGKPLIDRQHPHDFFMQLAASWRKTLGDESALVIAGGPAGEPTLGPVAFMHRASAAGLVLAPLGHHTFDSTHISFGVVTAALERGRWTFEGSAFNGREPDENRWNFDFGAMDSFAGRVWFRPTKEWEVQVSTGRLKEPEELEPGDVQRTTASASWFRQSEAGISAVTVGYGVNAAHGEQRHGVFGEFTLERHANSVFGRVEFQQVEADVLLTDQIPDPLQSGIGRQTVTALALGAARNLVTWRGFEGAVGGQVTFYGVPEDLRPTYGDHPISFQAFFRLRLPSGSMGRMWNMRMSQGPKIDMDHSGHVMR
ncbi:MAG TPA: hypothetical protein VJN96_09305 [Vicinamibacterales bacterium]|nr:hypothetical protein [Vicinamibacterales bacterium]